MTTTPLTARQRYIALWRALPRELGFHALTLPIATTGFVVAVTLISTGAVEKNVTAIFQKLGLDDSGTDHRRVLAVLAWLLR